MRPTPWINLGFPVDVSNVDLEENDFSGFNNATNSMLDTPKTKNMIRAKKSSKKADAATDDAYALSESPENEVSPRSELRAVLKKANEERDALVQQLIQPNRAARGKISIFISLFALFYCVFKLLAVFFVGSVVLG